MALGENRFSGLWRDEKPLKRLPFLRARYTPLKRGVNESQSGGAQKLRCAETDNRLSIFLDPAKDAFTLLK